MELYQVQEEFGQRLHIGSLGMVEEGVDKFRLIHDGTHQVLVNSRIRPRDHVPNPTVMDLAAEMAELEATVGLVWDFKSAHRLVPIRRFDWGLLACTLVDCRQDSLGAVDQCT